MANEEELNLNNVALQNYLFDDSLLMENKDNKFLEEYDSKFTNDMSSATYAQVPLQNKEIRGRGQLGGRVEVEDEVYSYRVCQGVVMVLVRGEPREVRIASDNCEQRLFVNNKYVCKLNFVKAGNEIKVVEFESDCVHLLPGLCVVGSHVYNITMNTPVIVRDSNNLTHTLEVRGADIKYEIGPFRPWICSQAFLCRVEKMSGKVMKEEIVFADGSDHMVGVGIVKVFVSVGMEGSKATIDDIEVEIVNGKAVRTVSIDGVMFSISLFASPQTLARESFIRDTFHMFSGYHCSSIVDLMSGYDLHYSSYNYLVFISDVTMPRPGLVLCTFIVGCSARPVEIG